MRDSRHWQYVGTNFQLRKFIVFQFKESNELPFFFLFFTITLNSIFPHTKNLHHLILLQSWHMGVSTLGVVIGQTIPAYDLDYVVNGKSYEQAGIYVNPPDLSDQ